jgi:hypothetical protein
MLRNGSGRRLNDRAGNFVSDLPPRPPTGRHPSDPDFGLLGNLKRVVNIFVEVTAGSFELAMAE